MQKSFCEDRIIVTEELNDSEIFEETIEESKAKILETDVLYVLLLLDRQEFQKE